MLSVSCGPGFGLPPNGLPLVSGGNCGFVLDPLTFEEAWNASSVFCASMQRRLCQVEQSQDEEFEERGKRQEITPGGGRRPRSLTVQGGPLDRYSCDCVTYVTHCAVTSRAAARLSSTLGMHYFVANLQESHIYQNSRQCTDSLLPHSDDNRCQS